MAVTTATAKSVNTAYAAMAHEARPRATSATSPRRSASTAPTARDAATSRPPSSARQRDRPADHGGRLRGDRRRWQVLHADRVDNIVDDDGAALGGQPRTAPRRSTPQVAAAAAWPCPACGRTARVAARSPATATPRSARPERPTRRSRSGSSARRRSSRRRSGRATSDRQEDQPPSATVRRSAAAATPRPVRSCSSGADRRTTRSTRARLPQARSLDRRGSGVSVPELSRQQRRRGPDDAQGPRFVYADGGTQASRCPPARWWAAIPAAGTVLARARR